MKLPQVPIYKYTFTDPPTHILVVYNHLEPIETGWTVNLDYCIGCSIGKKGDLYTDTLLIRLPQSIIETLKPEYYISSALASKILRGELRKNTNKPFALFGHNKELYVEKATELANKYQKEFEDYVLYVRQVRAVRPIQKVYLENYYNPERSFCMRRLHRDVERLQKK